MMKVLRHPVSAALLMLLLLLWLCFCCCHCCFTGTEHMLLHKSAPRGSDFYKLHVSVFVVHPGLAVIRMHQQSHPQQEHVTHQHQCSLTC
jgi:hypothetical protein